MALSWDEVTRTDGYAKLAPEQQAKAKRQYFDQVVAPRVAEPKRAAAWAQFEAYQPKGADSEADDMGAGDIGRGIAAKTLSGAITAVEGSTTGAVDAAQRVAEATGQRLANPEPFRFSLPTASPEDMAISGDLDPRMRPASLPNVAGLARDALPSVPDELKAQFRASAMPFGDIDPLKDTQLYKSTVGKLVDAGQDLVESIKTPRWKLAENAFARDLAATDQLPALEQAKAVVDILQRHPAVASGVLFESAPSMLASIATGRAVVTGGMKLVRKQAIDAGISDELATAIAQEWARNRGSALATAAVAGNATAQSVSSVADEVAQTIMSMPDEELQRVSPRYRDARTYLDEQQVKQIMASDAATEAAGSAALTTGLSSLLTAGFEARLGAPRQIAQRSSGRLMGAAEGIVKEGTQEAFESGGERYAQNVGLKESGARPDQDLSQGVAQESALGGIMGAVMGGVAGAVGAGPESDSTVRVTDDNNGLPTEARSERTEAGSEAPKPAGDDGNDARSEGNQDDEISAAMQQLEVADVPETDRGGEGGESLVGGGSSEPVQAAPGSGRDPGEGQGGTTEAVAGLPAAGALHDGRQREPALDRSAHEAATSPLNDIPDPTEAQKEAGNYRKGHIKLQGLDISIENPAGSRRRAEWEPLQDHYGYIRGSKGRDKEHIDVFVGPKPDEQTAYVVDQIDPSTGRFDEHKIILGAASENEAREIYRRNYQSDWKGLGAISAVPMSDLKGWLATPQMRPYGKLPKPSKLGLLDDERLKSPELRRDIEAMAPQAGWETIGGKILRGADGEVEGRTPWVPGAPWFKSVQGDAGLPNNTSGRATMDAVRKALDGKPMSAAEKRHVGAMLDWAESERRDYDARGASGIDPFDLAGVAADKQVSSVSLVDEAVVAKAVEIDEAAVERAAAQHDDDAAFMAAIRGIIDGRAGEATVEGQGQNQSAGRGREGVQGAEAAAGRAGVAVDGGQAQGQVGSEVGERTQHEAPLGIKGGNQSPGGPTRNRTARDQGTENSRSDYGVDSPGSRVGDAAPAPALELVSQSEVELATRDQQQRESARKSAQSERDATQRAQADRDVDNFALTGSDRPADVAMAGGQRDLLSAATSVSKAGEGATAFVFDPSANGKAPDKKLGTNADGDPIFEDRRGVRYITHDGIKVQAPVGLVPVRNESGGISYESRPRNDDARFQPTSAAEDSAKTSPDSSTAKPASQKQVSAPVEESAVREEKLGQPPLRIEPHGKSMIVVRGETKANKDRIKAIGGAMWHRGAEGWVFKKERESDVRAALGDLIDGDHIAKSSHSAYDAKQSGNVSASGEGADVQSQNTDESRPVQAGDGGRDREDGRAGEPNRGSVGGGMAEADQSSRSQRKVAGRDTGADDARAAREGSGSSESLDGGNRDSADGRALRRPAGIVDEPAGDHVINDADRIGEGGEKTKARQNLAAIDLVKRLASEGRAATADERQVLARYVGWGGLKNIFDAERSDWAREHAELRRLLTDDEFAAARASMLDAHYTSLPIVDAMWSAAKRLGFDGGRVLEPAMGTGNFFGRMPPDVGSRSVLNGVELDVITGMIAKQLYQRADIASPKGFQDTVYPADSADLVIGNPPFGSQVLTDTGIPEIRGFSIHNFFFAKAVHVARPGGLVEMVVSHSLMDARDPAARLWIAERAHLLGAIRLPYSAFLANAGTEVVTDILFLQKAMPGEKPDTAWTGVRDLKLRTAAGEWRDFSTSAYFHANPAMVLGKQSASGKMYGRPDQYNVEPDGDLGQALAAAIARLPEGVIKPVAKPVEMSAVREALVPEHVKVYGYFVENGEVMQRVTDTFDGKQQAQPVAFTDKTAPKRATGMIAVRDALRGLMRAELSEESSNADLATLRAELNRAYDAFVKAHGYINAQSNRRVFRDDPDLPLLESLEPGYDPGVSKDIAKRREIEPRPAKAGKADIFRKRVLQPTAVVTKVASAKDALIASLNAHGRVDPAYMAGLYGKDFADIADELGDLVYDDPTERTWQTAETYLSGNVKQKLRAAQQAAAKDARFDRNVRALEAVQPADVPALKIGVRLGSPWVPHRVIEDFARSLLGQSAQPAIRYVRATGRWSVDILGADKAASISRWGTERVPAAAVMSAVMNNKQIVVKDNHGTASHPLMVVNEPETESARARAEEMATKFKEWIWEDQDRRSTLEKLYNDGYNTDRRRVYDGSHLTLPGSSPAIQLRPHQKSGIWRGIQEPSELLDHVVGAGKTYEMAGIAMELRRLGISRKPTFAVPNHLVRQWRDEIYKLYPNANVLAATEADFERKNRQRLFGRIATGDWDAIIVGHSSFQRIGTPREAEKEILKEQLDEITAAIEQIKRERADRHVVRDMERIKQNLQEKMKALASSAGKKDDFLAFDELGIDALFVDEAHLFKNLFYMSQMRGIAGMGTPSGSGRAFDLFVKTQYLSRRYGKQARVVFATGTPISNSLVEMYTMQRYLAYDELKRRGIVTLDAWAGVYGDVQNVYEVHPSGTGYRLKSRFAKFVNLPSLMELYRSFADVVSLDDLKSQAAAQAGADGKPGRFPVPKVKGGRPANVVAERSERQTLFFGVPEFARTPEGAIQFKYPANLQPQLSGAGKWMLVGGEPFMVNGVERMSDFGGPFESEAEAKEQAAAMVRQPVVGYNRDSILWKFENLKNLNKQTNGKINALSVTNEARKAGLDYRLIDPTAPDHPGSKLNLAVSDIKRIYDAWSADRGTQLVFCDLSTPQSARASAATREKPAFVRADDGALRRVKATVAALEGQPVAFLVVKEKGSFKVYDGVTGVNLRVEGSTREEAISELQKRLVSRLAKAVWLDDMRSRFTAIDDDVIAEWKASQDQVEEEGEEDDGITVGDLMALSGSGRFSVYDDVKAKLIAAGIPANEVAFIHDFDTAAKKAGLYRDVNDGRIRVLMGSTEKMGAGTNVQRLLVAEHHLDAPWRPSDLEQREGRIIRQGNLLYERDPDGFEVEINRYATKQTYDTRMWQLIEHKAAGIEQLRKADASVFEIDDVGGEEANAADMKAAASGNPLILDEIKLRNDVKSLEAQQWAHQSSLHSLQGRIANAKGARSWVEKKIAQFQPFIDLAEANPSEPFSFTTPKGKVIDSKADVANPITTAFMRAVQERSGYVTAGEYRGAQIIFEHNILGVSASLLAGDADLDIATYTKDDKLSIAGLFTRIDNKLYGLKGRAAEMMREAESEEAQLPGLLAEANRPFPKSDELSAKRAEHRKVMNLLAKAGGGIELTPAMNRELKRAIATRLGLVQEDGEAAKVSPASRARSSISHAALSAASVRAIAEEAYGSRGISTLVGRGILSFVDGAGALPSALQDYADHWEAENPGRHVVALTDHASGKVYLISDRIRASEVAGLIMHEIGEHYGLQRMLGEREYKRVLAAVREAHGTGQNPAVDEAWAHVTTHYGELEDTSDQFVTEVLAHLSESEAFRKTSLWQRILSAIRQFLFRIGFTRRLSDSDLGIMVASALRRSMVPGTVNTTAAGDPRMQAAQAAAAQTPVFKSQLEEVLRDKLPNRGGAKIYKSMVEAWQRKGELKKEELDWIGLVDWLDTQGPALTKDDVLAFLRDNAVQVGEVEFSSDSEIQTVEQAKSLLRDMTGADPEEEYGYENPRDYIDAARAMVLEEDATKFSQYQTPGGEDYRELLLTLPPADGQGRYKSPHWDEPNVLAHVRFNDRFDADGKRVLFVEEVQSDWHQTGRKQGYGKPGVPDAPFKQSWPMLAMKRMIRYAAENGFERIAWTTGGQQEARYPDDTVSQETKKRRGDGMRAFYDRELVNEVGRYVKKWGAKVGTTKVETAPAAGRFASAMLGRRDRSEVNRELGMSEVHAIDVTPEMKASALKPQPMFAVRKAPTKQQLMEDDAWRKAGLPRENPSLVERLERWASARWDKVKEDLLDNFQTGVFDRFKPIKDAEGNIDAARSGYVSARLSTGGSSVLYGAMLYGSPVMRDGLIQKKEGSRGLLEILRPVSGDLNRWAAWMVGKRADMLADQHRENNLTLEEIAYLKSLAGEDEAAFEAVAKDVRSFMTDILNVMRVAGLLTEEQVESFSKDAYYLPFYRVDEDGDATMPFIRRGLSHQSSQIKRLKGGVTAINDPIENLFAHLSRSIDASMKNYALARTITNTTKFLSPAKEGDRAKALRVMWKGKPLWFNVDDPALLRALTAIGEKPRDGVALTVGRSMRSLLTTGVTLDPAFMLRNFMRDSMHSWIIDKNTLRFGLSSLKGARSTLKTIQAHATDPNAADPDVVSMMFAGASFVGGHVYGNDPKASAAAMRKALRRRGLSDKAQDRYMASLVTTGKQFASMYVEIGEAIENANRVAVFKSAIDNGATLASALYEAKDLMDFSLRGQWTTVQVMSDVLPFFNARLQGLYKLGREAGRDPKVLGLVATRIAARGALLALASVALVGAYAGDDRYEELEEWDKDANWHFWVGGTHYRIPKPFELGILFATIPERMYRLAVGADRAKETLQSIVHGIVTTLEVNPIPQAIRPLVETYFNFDMFRQRPIETAADQARLPQDRYSSITSPTMVAVGQAGGWSPKKLEYWWDAYLGTLGSYALMVPDTLVRVARGDVQPTRHLEDYPIIGSFARTGPARNTEYQTELYELAKQAEQTNRSIRDKFAAGETEAGKRLAAESAELLAVRKMLDKTTDRIAKLRKQRDAIYRDPQMSSEQKRSELDAIQTEINDAAKRVMTSPEVMAAQ
jgi:N12 class adenine-specific DNA methylase